jgi:catechol 2,3-dioxygenase-like lactoylglutathione lyase family enzyme
MLQLERGDMDEQQPIAGARFGHVNVIAEDWRRLADFYTRLFGCEFVPPERNYEGEDLSRGTGVEDAALQGVHLRLPGHGENGPTIEIYQYRRSEPRSTSVANRLGFSHICFQVDDVPAAREAVLGAGGREVGEIVTLTTATGGRVTWCYVTDPESNMIELQAWARTAT